MPKHFTRCFDKQCDGTIGQTSFGRCLVCNKNEVQSRRANAARMSGSAAIFELETDAEWSERVGGEIPADALISITKQSDRE